VSTIGSPTYHLTKELAKFCHNLWNKLEDTFVENSADFLWKMNRVTLDRQEKIVSFDVVSLFTKDNTDAWLYYTIHNKR